MITRFKLNCLRAGLPRLALNTRSLTKCCVPSSFRIYYRHLTMDHMVVTAAAASGSAGGTQGTAVTASYAKSDAASIAKPTDASVTESASKDAQGVHQPGNTAASQGQKAAPKQTTPRKRKAAAVVAPTANTLGSAAATAGAIAGAAATAAEGAAAGDVANKVEGKPKASPRKRKAVEKSAAVSAEGVVKEEAAAVNGETASVVKSKAAPRKRKAAASGDDKVDAQDSHLAAQGDEKQQSPKAKAPRARKAATAAVNADDTAVAPPNSNGVDAAPGPSSAASVKKPVARQKAVAWPPGPLYTQEMRPPKYEGPAYRIMSWNLAGLRAVLRKDPEALAKLVAAESLDVLCLQETKLQELHVKDIVETLHLPGWSHHWSCSGAKKGYSGTVTLCKQPPLNYTVGIGHVDHDDEGRVVTAEFPEFYLLNCYCPNAQEELRRLDYRLQWDEALAKYVQKLQAVKPVVLVGDLNVAPEAIDLARPKTNTKSAGFSNEERESFAFHLMGYCGLVDTFRAQHPGVVGYTFYSLRSKQRASGMGWRVDHCLVSKSLAGRVYDSYIRPDVEGSDHVPLGLVLRKE